MTEKRDPVRSAIGVWLANFPPPDRDLAAAAELMVSLITSDVMATVSERGSRIAEWLASVQAAQPIVVGLADSGTAVDSLSVQQVVQYNILVPESDPNLVQRNKFLTALIVIVLVVLASPAYQSYMPPEVMTFLHEDYGPFCFCTMLVSSVTAAMAAVNKRKNKD